MKITRTLLVGVALLSTMGLGLSGCAKDASPQDEQTAAPSASTSATAEAQELVFMESPNSVITLEDENGEVVVPATGNDDWVQLAGGDIELTLHGSSSCPPSVEKVTKESRTVKVELKKVEADRACTMDYRSFFVTIVAGDVEKVEISSNTDGNTTELPKR